MISAAAPPIDILVVDDDAIDRLATTRALARSEVPARVHEATTADSALDLLKARPFACAILDVRMPGHDGEWLLRAARGAGLTTPIIVLTGHGDEATAVELMKAGASDYLSKVDLTAERLGQSLRHVLRVYAAEEQARQALERLRRSEQRLKAAVDVAALGTFERNLRTGELSCDARCKALHGFAGDEEVELEGIRRCIFPEDRRALSLLFDEACAPRSRGSYEAAYRVHHAASDEERWLKVTAQVSFEGERAQRVIGIVKDITAQRRYDEQRERQVAFEQELIGIVSHDLRNPIAAMMLSASSLLLRTKDDPVVQRMLARIVSSGERANRMVLDLLDFTRARMGGGIPITPAPCDLHDVTRVTLDEVLAGFPERVVDHERHGDGHGLWDADRLAQVVTNLASNALTYSPDSTRVAVRTIDDGDDILLEVHNHGEAIDDELLSTLFEPFRRGPAKGGERSVGLGLYIVSQIVAAHGGHYEVTSCPNDGTTFRVRLPRRAPTANAS